MRRAALGVPLAAMLCSGCAVGETRFEAPTLSEQTACRLVQQRVAAANHLPRKGPPGIGWFCDLAKVHDPALYVIALRSGRSCEGTCSNLMGWYAVRKSDGTVGGYDIESEKWVPLAATQEH